LSSEMLDTNAQIPVEGSKISYSKSFYKGPETDSGQSSVRKL